TAAPAVDLERLATSARRDAVAVRRMLETIRNADPKLASLQAWLDGRPAGRKTVVFTEFRDTARSLWRALTPTHRVGRVDGTGAWLGARPAGRRSVVERFAPLSSGARPPPDRERVDLLIATDVLSEGLNLQDADTVVSYDLPWNPVRLLQRIGRVDRLGSPHEVVHPVLFVPGAGLDDVLRLTRSLRSKLGGIAETLGAGDAVDLLAHLGGADPSRALDGLAPADPWERLRGAAARLEGTGGDRVTPAIGAVRPDRSAPETMLWLILASPADGAPALLEVRDDDEVRDAGADAAAGLERALGETRRAEPAGDRRAELERRATAAARLVRRHFEARACAGRAPARMECNGPATRIAVRLRRAIRELGPEPDTVLLDRADLALERLARPLDLPATNALVRLVAGSRGGRARMETPPLRDLISELDEILPGGGGAAEGEGRSAVADGGTMDAPVEVLAAIRIPVRQPAAPVDGGGTLG
ncbi:MAG TPA: C-terminal helicase domain-containing protein, partial [Gemmatimonadales bacterium]|nr:C-terminal helicase domain-containing protein [Gemmatimonadales bacterium]